VMKIQKVRGRLEGYVEKLPSPLALVRQFRDRRGAPLRTR
jgi:hypothetical protein